ncbi:MAG: hypothetical protein M3357_05650, partial [Actinomycetota bacterium]|nr:hypothetical protein [Actinomycetota bacterium]
SDALTAFARETTFARLCLDGLDPSATAELLGALGGDEFDERVGRFWAQETAGNPFFIGELVRHLVEEGTLYRGPDGRWTADRSLRELALPDTVRDVVARRVARLPDPCRRFLSVASAFEGPCRLDVVARVADLAEDAALDAVDHALAAGVLEATGATDTYVFHHALIRHTLYDQITPSRRVRLHRRAAEALEAEHGVSVGPADAGEIAVQWHRSRGLPGSERGVDAALMAADHAQARGGHDEAVGFLRMSLDLLPDDDERRPRLLGRLGIVLAWALRHEEAADTAGEAADAIAETEGNEAAAAYLAEATYVCGVAGSAVYAWELARRGLAYTGGRDLTWALLVSFDYERRAAENADHPGIPLDTAERRESGRIIRQAHLDRMGLAPAEAVFDTREEALESSNLAVLGFWAGEYQRCLPLVEAETAEAEALGRIARAARGWSHITSLQVALGQLQEAQLSLRRAESLAGRLGTPLAQLFNARNDAVWVLDDGWEELLAAGEAVVASAHAGLAWALGPLHAMMARAAGRLGRVEHALRHLRPVLPWLERAPAWTNTLPLIASDSAEALWLLERVDDIATVERALRDKIVAADFRYANTDARLSLARLCALCGRHDEARSWLADARRVLTEQQARPLLAVCDYDEALMYLRRGPPGDPDRARLLLEAARRQFVDMGMTGWIRRTDELFSRMP